ncbi:hypothetical protein [Acetobacter orientalis]|uniref:hypothetical protein n=1 Tax=Acetobacter orientalis TaxID=146474 RepID=UPI00241C9F75|nr:hypothetical protein [Acetobacter orientalis]
MMLAALWHAYGPLIETLSGGGVLGWYGRVATVRAQARRDVLAAGDQALRLNDTLVLREQRLAAQLKQSEMERWSLLSKTQDVYAEAIAARLIVHDLDAAAGRAMRVFRPLPPYPFPAQTDESVAGATAAVTAEPRADSTHV